MEDHYYPSVAVHYVFLTTTQIIVKYLFLQLILLPGANSNPESKASQKDNKDSDGNENNQHVCSKNEDNDCPSCMPAT